MKDGKLYEVTIYVDGMMYPEVATLEIEAPTAEKARKWVSDRIRIMIEEENKDEN